MLYEARDKAVLKIALENTEDAKRKAEIQTALNRELKRSPSLEYMFAGCCHKMNAVERATYRQRLEDVLKTENVSVPKEKLKQKLASFNKVTKEQQNER